MCVEVSIRRSAVEASQRADDHVTPLVFAERVPEDLVWPGDGLGEHGGEGGLADAGEAGDDGQVVLLELMREVCDLCFTSDKAGDRWRSRRLRWR